MKAPTKFRAGVIGTALAFFLIVQWLSAYPEIVETYYSNGLYPILTIFISGITGQFNFSISEFATWFTLLILLPAVVGRIVSKKMSLSRALLNITMAASLLILWFYLFWGLNYLRLPLSTKLGLDEVQLEIDAFDSTFVNIINNTNELNLSYAIQDIDFINKAIEASYPEVLNCLDLKQVAGSKRLKSLVNNWLLNKTTTSGWYSPFFHEVHYNEDILAIEQPFVLAHEKAHQMGYTSEAEANFLAFLVCINSDEALIQYSGYFSLLGYFLQSSKRIPEKRQQYTAMIAEGVRLDLVAVSERWKSHSGFVSNISSVTYDIYLKVNRIPEGRLSYSHVVDMIIKYSGKNNPLIN